MEKDLEALASAWIEFCEETEKSGNQSSKAKSLFWAFEDVDSLCDDAPERALSLIKGALALTENEFVLANLAAGPLEDLLARHGSKIIADIEASAESDPRFRVLLLGVWRDSIDDGVWDRVLQARSRSS